jgi:hypothetical protein
MSRKQQEAAASKEKQAGRLGAFAPLSPRAHRCSRAARALSHASARDRILSVGDHVGAFDDVPGERGGEATGKVGELISKN